MMGATLYLTGRQSNGELNDAVPCSMCKRAIINSGIKEVIARNADGSYTVTDVNEWIENDDSLPEQFRT